MPLEDAFEMVMKSMKAQRTPVVRDDAAYAALEAARLEMPLYNAWRRAMSSDGRKFLERVVTCDHDLGCTECCWEYSVPVENQRQGLRGQFAPSPRFGGFPVMKVAWMLYHDTNVPEGKRIFRVCDTRACANPMHGIPH